MTAGVSRTAVEACCAALYGDELVELIAGQSLHPGGLAGTRRLLAEARLGRGARLLDAGCGLGASARLAAREFGLAVDACDVSRAALRRAAQLARDAGADIRFAEASMLKLPYPAGTFSAVIAECVLSTTSKSRGLRELRRVTEDGGWLLLSDVTATESERVVAPEPLASVLCLSSAWRPAELERLIDSSGWRIVHSSDETSALGELVDRLEARLQLMSAVARDGVAGERLVEAHTSLARLARSGVVGEPFGAARELLREGRIVYRSVVARAI